MPISDEVHARMTRLELHSLIMACDECECEPPCYCASNREWAEKKLAEMDTPALLAKGSASGQET